MRWPLSVLSAVVVVGLGGAEVGLTQERKGRAADLPTQARTAQQVAYGDRIQLELRQTRPGGWPLPFGVQFGPGLSGGDPGAGPAAYGADSVLIEIVVPVN